MKTFLLGAHHFRDGKLFRVGESITVPDNEVQSKTWTLTHVDARPATPSDILDEKYRLAAEREEQADRAIAAHARREGFRRGK